MKVALLGAGHIGQTIARLLHDSGDYAVTVIDRQSAALAPLAVAGIATRELASDDPAALFPPDGQIGGALVPFAQHKGYALAMVVEVLAAALTGGETTRPANLKYQFAVWNNMLAMVFDPARLNDQQLFGAEVNAFVDWVQSARLRDDAEPILMPGDPERASRKARAQRMPVDEGTLVELDEAATAVNKARGTALPALSSFAL